MKCLGPILCFAHQICGDSFSKCSTVQNKQLSRSQRYPSHNWITESWTIVCTQSSCSNGARKLWWWILYSLNSPNQYNRWLLALPAFVAHCCMPSNNRASWAAIGKHPERIEMDRSTILSPITHTEQNKLNRTMVLDSHKSKRKPIRHVKISSKTYLSLHHTS